MATIDDVQNAMVNVITPALYPNGTNNPSIVARDIYIYPGFPLKQNLDADLAAGNINVSVFAQKGMTRNTTRVRDLYADTAIDVATIILDVVSNTVTVNGSVTVGQTSVVIVNGIGYAYMAQTGDTLDSIADVLAGMIPNASALNNVITINNTNNIEARVSVPGTMRRILQSEEGIFRVRVIVPTPSQSIRETVGKAIQLAFLTLQPRYYLQMPDGVSASIRAKGIEEINTYELDLALVRDYLYLVEYHAVDVETFQTIADPIINNTVSNIPIS